MPCNEYKFKPLKQSKYVAHPLVRTLVTLMNEQGVTPTELCNECGVPKDTFYNWRKSGRGSRRVSPSVANLEACFNAIGYGLVPVSNGTSYIGPGRAKTYVCTSPNGAETPVLNLSDFAKLHGLDRIELYRCARTGRTHKGWSVRRD
jgi:hypothetical protein